MRGTDYGDTGGLFGGGEGMRGGYCLRCSFLFRPGSTISGLHAEVNPDLLIIRCDSE